MLAKKRAINSSSQSSVAQLRKQLYTNAYLQIQMAIEQGFYLEAITLCESMISDRLESRIAYLTGQDQQNRQFSNLGPLLGKLKSANPNNRLENSEEALLLYEAIREWTRLRNTALHEMVKVAEDEHVDWSVRYQHNKTVALKGKTLANKLGNLVRKLNTVA